MQFPKEFRKALKPIIAKPAAVACAKHIILAFAFLQKSYNRE